MAAPRSTPSPKDASLKDRLGRAARAAPSGGRAKWIVWAIVGGAVLVVGVVQMLDPDRSPVARKVLEEHERREREEQERKAKAGAPAPAAPTAPAAPNASTAPAAPADATGQGTTK